MAEIIRSGVQQLLGDFLLGDHVLAPLEGLTADAVIVDSTTTVEDSFTADGVLLKTIAASLSVNAVLQRAGAGSATANSVIVISSTGSFSAGAWLLRTQTASFLADAVVAALEFTADAWIIGTRWRHHRQRDHFGSDSDLYVGLSERIGPWEQFTPVHFVIEDLAARIVSLETTTKVLASFTGNAVILALGGWAENPAGTWTSSALANAVLRGARSGSFTASAWLNRGGSFTADASLNASFTANAVLA